MKLLFLDAYFIPENIAFTHLENDLLSAFVDAGHKIDVICPVPTRGISKEAAAKYRKNKYEELLNGCVKVHRFLAPRERKNPIMRAFRYLWCNSREYSIGRKFKDTDVIFAASTPPTQGLLACKLKKKLNCRAIYSLQDIFPDSLVNTGMTVRGSLLWRLGRKVENYTYRNADKIIVIGEDFKRNIMDKGVPEEKIEVIYNWIDTETLHPVDREDNTLFDELGYCRDGFYVTYAGNLGAAQGILNILQAAILLTEYKNIRFVIFGNGAQEDLCRKLIKDNNLENVKMFPLQSKERLSEVYSMGDISLISCKKGTGKGAFPSKTWSILAAGTPAMALYDTDTELRSILEGNDCGVCIDPDDSALVQDKILAYFNDRSLGLRQSKNARRFACEKAAAQTATARYVNALHITAAQYDKPPITAGVNK